MTAKNAGRSTARMRRLAANLRSQRRPCCLCGQAIDYSLPAEHPDSFTVEHLQPLSLAPHLAEDPTNFGAAHRRCNSSRGNRNPKPSLGQGPRQW